MVPGDVDVVAVGGHESDGGRALRGLPAPWVDCVSSGRELLMCVSASRARGRAVCVVPMALGRDPDLDADAARTLLALSAEDRAGTVLAGPFGTQDHLVGWLRAAAARVAGDTALLVTAPSGGPFADADLFRIARLVRQYGRHRTVEVALIGGDPDPAEGVRRCLALGERRVVLLPAAWVTPEIPDPDCSERGGPLLSAPAVAGVLRARVHEAWERYDRLGDDGLSRALAAAHGHAHSHAHGHPPGGHPPAPVGSDGPHARHETHRPPPAHHHGPGHTADPQHGHRASPHTPPLDHPSGTAPLRGAGRHVVPPDRSFG